MKLLISALCVSFLIALGKTAPADGEPFVQDCGTCPKVIKRIRKYILDDQSAGKVIEVFLDMCTDSGIDKSYWIDKYMCRRWKPKIEDVAPMIANLIIPDRHCCEVLDECQEIDGIK